MAASTQQLMISLTANHLLLHTKQATFDLVCQVLKDAGRVGDHDDDDNNNTEKLKEVEKLRRRVMGKKWPRRDSV